MSLFALKLILAPLLIALATLVARRWGPGVGGWFIGLPLTSGPVSALLALEHGPAFAAAAAAATIWATLTVIVFCVVYARAAQRFSWIAAYPAALAAFFLAVPVFSRITIPAVPAALVAAAVLAGLLFVEKEPDTKPAALPAFPWDIPLRMITAACIVFLVTALSESLGPALSGIFSAFPVFISVMFIFSHKLCGVDSVRQMERGTITGSFAFITFFMTVSLAMPHWNMALVYLFAVAATMGVSAGSMALVARLSHRKEQS